MSLESLQDSSSFHMIILIDRFGFPNGTASSNRVQLLGRALVEKGVRVTVLATKYSEYPPDIWNHSHKGICHGIHFEYTCGTQIRPSSFLVRRYYTLLGWLVAMWRLLAAKKIYSKKCCLYLYSDTPSLCIPAAIIAKLRGMPVVLELCEWSPAVPSCRRPVRWYYRHLRFQLADAVFAISAFLKDRVRSITQNHDRPKVFKIPILVDLNEPVPFISKELNEGNYVLWCGQVGGYLKSACWLVRAFAHVAKRYPECKFFIVGGHSIQEKRAIVTVMNEVGLEESHVVFTGYVKRERLLKLYDNAAALLVPLEDDERSHARFPTKIGEYLASGRPVITSSVGEISHFFKDGENAFLCPPEDELSFASKIEKVLTSPALAKRVGSAGRELAKQHFHYALYGSKIKAFIESLFVE